MLFSYVLYTFEGDKRVRLGEHVLGAFDLTRCSTDVQNLAQYPDLGVRLGYLHSFALTENYAILPITSSLFDYCYSIGEKSHTVV